MPRVARISTFLSEEATLGPVRYWERIQRKMEAMDPEAFATLALLLTDHPPVTQRLAEIGCPVTVIVGEEDSPFLEPARVLARGIPEAALAVIPDAGHNPQLENRDAWLREICEHLHRARGHPDRAQR
jgi:pimeloyl-ACP methyl ester carboxylesterase